MGLHLDTGKRNTVWACSTDHIKFVIDNCSTATDACCVHAVDTTPPDIQSP